MKASRPELGLRTRRTRIKAQLSRALDHPMALRIMMSADRFVLRIALSGSRGPDGAHVILNSPGSGNIGDQAMFESFLRNVPGQIIAIVKSSDAYTVPQTEDQSRIAFAVLPNLVYSKFIMHYADLWQLGRRIRSAASFSVMGADIMDGGYGKHSSMVEWNIARTVHDAGISSRVLGFSWNGRAPREVSEQARLAGDAGVRILARDPDSHERLLADGVKGVVQSSDMVFSFKAGGALPTLPSPLQHLRKHDGKIAVVNISGLIGRSIEQNQEYDHLLETLENLGYKTVLLPHVSHSNVDDISAAVKLRAVSQAAQRAAFVDRLLSPVEVSSIVQRADVVVTGRMHLSILGLSAGKPVIVLATQGKVSGLMSLFGVPDHCVEPTEGFGQRLADLVVQLEDDRQSVVSKVDANLGAVQKLSALNFDRLDAY